jgi:septal ring factor EnvC (AmiA/AmiB activator)
MEQRIEKLEQRVSSLETRIAVAETNIKDIKADLDSIKNNTTWILRLVLGAIIMALIGLVIKGGV